MDKLTSKWIIESAFGSVVAGLGCYYFVRGAADPGVALRIAMVSFIGHAVARVAVPAISAGESKSSASS